MTACGCYMQDARQCVCMDLRVWVCQPSHLEPTTDLVDDQRTIAEIRSASLPLLELSVTMINERSVTIRPAFTPPLCQLRTLTPAQVALGPEITARSEVSRLSAPDLMPAGSKKTGTAFRLLGEWKCLLLQACVLKDPQCGQNKFHKGIRDCIKMIGVGRGLKLMFHKKQNPPQHFLWTIPWT